MLPLAATIPEEIAIIVTRRPYMPGLRRAVINFNIYRPARFVQTEEVGNDKRLCVYAAKFALATLPFMPLFVHRLQDQRDGVGLANLVM